MLSTAGLGAHIEMGEETWFHSKLTARGGSTSSRGGPSAPTSAPSSDPHSSRVPQAPPRSGFSTSQGSFSVNQPSRQQHHMGQVSGTQR